MEERIIDPEPLPEELPSEISLRPTTLDEYMGQAEIKRNLRIFIEAARERSLSAMSTRETPSDRARSSARALPIRPAPMTRYVDALI